MNSNESFYSLKAFADRLHFPYGFARSGQFSKKQATLIEQHGEAYKNLASGQQAPNTPEEQEFVRLCHGLKDAETEHEKVWAFYLQFTGRKVRYVSIGAGFQIPSFENDSTETVHD
ncbi:DUF413 domain-containing protein [Reinekea sp.]|jgi:uncharacterized protein YifE (UPF0438 family)|uniref:DUF413 domain-containing protein n=1 Tax=Reinekea sp. TaxID=1970455 RepID=UPI002A80AFCD|nr:DUF413 domain-containing protein [Reinekea sp.]